MSADFRRPPYVTARCIPLGTEDLADALNDAEWIEENRRFAAHATALRNTLAAILSTKPGSLEYVQAKLRGASLLRRIERSGP